MAWDIAQLFRRHRTELERFLRRRGLSHDLAADLSQDTFVRLMTAPSASQVIEPRRYLYRIAANLSIDLARRQAVARLVADGESVLQEMADGQPSAERVVISRQEIAIIEAALGEVPQGPRAAFLARIDGLTFAEISKQQGIPLKTIFTQVMKVTMHLKARLDAAR